MGGRHYVSHISPFHNIYKLQTTDYSLQVNQTIGPALLSPLSGLSTPSHTTFLTINKPNLFSLLNLRKVYLILYFRIAGEEIT